jgi:hypothetical protein
MTPEQFVAVAGALAALLASVGVLIGQVRATHKLVNSRLDELIALTRKAALAEGRLSEREHPGQNPGSGTST